MAFLYQFQGYFLPSLQWFIYLFFFSRGVVSGSFRPLSRSPAARRREASVVGLIKPWTTDGVSWE
jgi:hypothetical protein